MRQPDADVVVFDGERRRFDFRCIGATDGQEAVVVDPNRGSSRQGPRRAIPRWEGRSRNALSRRLHGDSLPRELLAPVHECG